MRINCFIAHLAVLSLVLLVEAQIPKSCSGVPNMQSPSLTSPKLIKQIANGKLTVVDSVNPPISVVHVYGTDYEMGYAYGVLLQDQIHKLVDQFYDYAYKQIDKYLSDLPDFIRKAIEEGGVYAALELTYFMTKPYTPPHFYEELRGISDGAQIDYMELVRVQMLPELIQAACSMYGAWGPAIKNGTLLQLRALDWEVHGPFQQFPVLTVYHPKPGNGHAFSTASFAGFIGAITGYSSAPMGVCEKVWLQYNGTKHRAGVPWHFLLRDILQYDSDIDNALSRIASADRTCSIWIGLGDWTDTQQFKIVAYSPEDVQVHNDRNTKAYSGHPVFPGLLYLDRHVQPSHNPCMGDLMSQFYGEYTPLNTIQYITAGAQTGDAQIAIFDYAANELYLAYASPVDSKGNVVPAYSRPFIRVSMTELLNL
jgi:hypothetical protein